MPHAAFIAMTGFRIVRPGLAEVGLQLPGLRDRAAAIERLPALGLLTLAGLTPEHYSCSYHQSGGVGDEEFVESIVEQRPAVAAISALTASATGAYKLSRELRRAGMTTVLGGLHATACAEEAREHFDAVVAGDGESSWLKVLRDIEHGELRPIYRGPTTNLAESPVPRWDLLGRGVRSRFTLQTQRGCPFACEFCAASRLLGGFREKPVEAIRRELANITSIDRRPLIELADDNTFAGRRDAHELLAALSESNARWFTESDWRLGTRPDVLAELAASGCVQVLVGIESLVRQYDGMGTKSASLGEVMDALHAIQESSVAVIGCLVLGADGETRESIDALAEFLDHCGLADVQVTLQTPFPGTALRRRLEREGRLLPDRGWDYCTLFDVAYRPDPLTVPELESAFLELLRWTYRPQATQRREAIRRTVWHNNPAIRGSLPLQWHDSLSATASRS